MGQEQDSPIEEKPVDDVASAATALSSMMSDEGELPPHDLDAEAAQATTEGTDQQNQQQPEKPAPETEKPAISLKIGDKEFTIPADNIPEELRDVVKDGLMMRADYTRKVMEAAEQRRAVEAQRGQIAQAYQVVQAFPQHFAAIQAVEQRINQLGNVDWSRVRAEDPTGITEVRLRQDLLDLQANRHRLYGELQGAHQAITAQQEQEYQARLAAELPKVKEVIPDFGQTKVKELRDGALKHYGKLGVTEQALNNVSTAFELAILNDALQWRALQEKAPAVSNKVQQLPPRTVRSGTAQTPQTGAQVNQSAMQRLQRGGKVEDAAAAIKSLLG